MQVQNVALAQARRGKVGRGPTGKALRRMDEGEQGNCLKSGADIAPTFLEHGLSVAMGIKCETGASRRMPIRTIKWVGRIPTRTISARQCLLQVLSR